MYNIYSARSIAINIRPNIRPKSTFQTILKQDRIKF